MIPPDPSLSEVSIQKAVGLGAHARCDDQVRFVLVYDDHIRGEHAIERKYCRPLRRAAARNRKKQGKGLQSVHRHHEATPYRGAEESTISSVITPSGKLRARPASAQQSCDNPSTHCTAALPARQLHLLVMPMQKENASRADEAYSCNELNLPRGYCRRPPRSPQHPPTNVTARATKPDAIQRARPREATKPTTTCATNPNCRE